MDIFREEMMAYIFHPKRLSNLYYKYYNDDSDMDISDFMLEYWQTFFLEKRTTKFFLEKRTTKFFLEKRTTKRLKKKNYKKIKKKELQKD